MARSSPIAVPDFASERGATPVYFLTVPELAYKALSDAAAKRNKTVTQLVAEAITKYLKDTEGV